MGVEAIDHVQLAMPAGREDDAVSFYEGVLGIEQVAKPTQLGARGGCWFAHGTVKVHLGVDPDFVPARKAHPAFVVTGLAALIEALRSAGSTVNDAEPVDGFRRIHVFDPFGNRIELMEHHG